MHIPIRVVVHVGKRELRSFGFLRADVSVRTGKVQLPTSTKAGSFCPREIPPMMGRRGKVALCNSELLF